MELRPYQVQAVDWLVPRQRGLVQSPAGSGKTVMGAAALDRVISPHDNVLVIANTMDQLGQWSNAVDLFGVRKRATVDFICGVGNLSETDYDIIIVDECHHATAPTWWSKIENTKARVWGFSATPWTGDEERDTRLKTYFGAVHVVERDELVETGHVLPAEVRFIKYDDFAMTHRINTLAKELIEKRKRRYPFLFRSKESATEQENRATWQACMQIGLCDNPVRDFQIMRRATAESLKGESVLILVPTIEHGKGLQEKIGTDAELVHSKMGKKARAAIIARFKTGETPILLATTLADEGLDCPIAGVLIVAMAGRSKNKLIQRTGRVLRPHKGKTNGVIYDFWDDSHFMLLAQSKSRLREYRKLNYRIAE